MLTQSAPIEVWVGMVPRDEEWITHGSHHLHGDDVTVAAQRGPDSVQVQVRETHTASFLCAEITFSKSAANRLEASAGILDVGDVVVLPGDKAEAEVADVRGWVYVEKNPLDGAPFTMRYFLSGRHGEVPVFACGLVSVD